MRAHTSFRSSLVVMTFIAVLGLQSAAAQPAGVTPSTALEAASNAEAATLDVEQDAAEPLPLSEALLGEAKTEYDAAKLLFMDGDLPGAATKFRRAYDLSRDPRLLWNVAACEKEQRHYAKASSLVTQYLAEASAMLSDESRAQAEETLASLRQFSSEVELEGTPAGAVVFVDGVEVGTTPLSSPLFLDLGVRQLEVRVPGYLPFQKELDVPGDKRLEVSVLLTKDTSSARLVVLTGQPKSVIIVDGTVRGSDHWEGGLTPGKHHVRITAPGKKPYETNVELAAQSSRTMEVVLEDKKRLWPWIVGGAAVVAGATVGGVFLFKEKKTVVEGPEGDLETIPLGFPFR